MGKTTKWFKHLFLTSSSSKKDNKRETRASIPENPTTTPISALPTTPKEKRRWSFRRSSGTSGPQPLAEPENEQKKHALAVAAAAAAAADAAATAAKAAAAVVRLTEAGAKRRGSGVEEKAAVKIQSVFRGYLARKALNALKGLVKLQALVRGHLVRKQAAATLRCMQALVTVQARARMQRIKINDEYSLNQLPYNINDQRQLNHRKSTQETGYRHAYNEMDRGTEENVKIVEMDYGDSRNSQKSRHSYSNYSPPERTDHRFSTQSAPNRVYMPKPDQHDISPAPSAMSALTEIMSPRACSNHFEEYSFNTAQSSPQYYSAISKPQEFSEFGNTPYSYHDHPFSPSYMANTQSSRAKARSQSAPKSRPDNISPQLERQRSKRRPSIEGRNVPRAVRMQRCSSHLGSTAQNFHYPWSVKLDKSSVSLKDSECGSTSTVLTNTQYCRSLVGFEVSRRRYK